MSADMKTLREALRVLEDTSNEAPAYIRATHALAAALDELEALRGVGAPVVRQALEAQMLELRTQRDEVAAQRDELLSALEAMRRDGCACAVNEAHQGPCETCAQSDAAIANARGGQ